MFMANFDMLSGPSRTAATVPAHPAQGQDLAALKRCVLDSMRDTLVQNVDPTKFLPFLRSRFVLNDRESAEIKSCCSKSVFEGADKLVDVLCTKGAKGYDIFCEAILLDQTQVFLLTGLNRRLEYLRHARNERGVVMVCCVRGPCIKTVLV